MVTREDWFPTSIWYFDDPNCSSLNERLMQAIEREQNQDVAGLEGRSNVNGWHSRDDLHKDAEFGEFVGHVRDNVLEVIRFLKWDETQVGPELINCWANVNKTHASNTLHNHPHSHLSGVYYVKAPDDCGDLIFRDPREAELMMAPPVVEFSHWTYRTVRYRPVIGRMIVFPSWLYHRVETNRSAVDRVCLSFNIRMAWKKEGVG